MTQAPNLTGQKFGEWTVLRKARRSGFWLCQCTCGQVRRVQSANLRNGQSKSCGCARRVFADRTRSRIRRPPHAVPLTIRLETAAREAREKARDAETAAERQALLATARRYEGAIEFSRWLS